MNQVARQAQEAPAPSSELLMQSLLQAAHSLEKRWEDALGTVGLSGPKFGVLTHLARASEPLSLSEIAERMTCVRSNITQLMDRLEADGLVQRVEDRSDRRTVRAALTPLGVKRQAAGAQEVDKLQKEFARTLAGIDLSALLRTLEAIR
jgi:DNA-binding MarR family transcriptional regulator